MKIAFVALPWLFHRPELHAHEGYSQNLGVAYLAAFARRHGHLVSFIDGFAEGAEQPPNMLAGNSRMYCFGLSPEQIAARLPEDADVIGITCPFNNQAPLIQPVANAIKSRFPDKRIILGGPYAIAYPRQALIDNPAIDIVVRGEGELPLLDVLEGKPLQEIKGLLFRSESGVVDNGLAPTVRNMDDLPFPARDLLPMDTYFMRSPRGDGASGQKAVSVTTSRGCPYQCEFCSLHNEENRYGYKFRGRSPANVMEEIDLLKEAYGEELLVQFEDDNILIQKDRAKEIFRQLAQKKVKWAIHSGVMIQLLDEELIILIKQSGCQQLNLALESGNATVLKAMKKKLDLENAARVVGWCKKHGIEMLAFLIIGYPGETDKTWQETMATLRRLRRLGLRRVAPFILNAHEGTPLHRNAKANGWLRTDKEATSDGELAVEVTTPDFDEEKVRRWHAEAAGVMHPYRYTAKRLLDATLPDAVNRTLLEVARRARGALRARGPGATRRPVGQRQPSSVQ